ncbi:MAG TPA: aspartate/glutamate racemase family protein [Bacteroidales bacterium]|nr:aspartate/glutamate racemase family protein [Bacteroidales bacterium]HPT04658.1 aspartate/glutamate racemase family protein [Bacteroidales bacterium]
MKTIGLIGGLSWKSTQEYYRIINQSVAQKAGNHHSAKIILNSLDFGEVERCISNNDFEGLTTLLVAAARSVEKAGADFLLICANTMHFLADAVQAAVAIPLVHIADATIAEIMKKNATSVGLLGTQFTMEQNFYTERIKRQGIDALIPELDDRQFIQQTIFNELFFGTINPESKSRFLKIISWLESRGAQGIVLGCTEIPLLIKQNDTTITLFDTTEIHALKAVELAME